MKLVRYGAIGQEKPGLIDKSGQLRDLSAHAEGPRWRGLFAGLAGQARRASTPPRCPPSAASRGSAPPSAGMPKFVAIGLNYADHAKETGMPIPAEPIFFLKANTALCGPNDTVEKPRGSTKLDWEVEIATIIGTRAKYVSEADALNHVAGYCICNDVSERILPARAPRTMDQGQVARHLRPARPVARDQGRDPGRAEAVDVARRQRQALPDRIDLDHDLHAWRSAFPTSRPS